MMRSKVVRTGVCLVGLLGCGDGGGGSGEGTSGGGTTGGGGSSGATGEPTTGESVPTLGTSGGMQDTSASSGPGETGDSGDSGDMTTGVGPPTARFPQAIAGAMAAHPATYASLPVHVAVTGAVDAVRVRLDDGPEVAASAGAGTWVAAIPVMGASDGPHQLTATVSGGEGMAEASAELVLDPDGVQWTDVTIDGKAGTPIVHRRRDEDLLWLTWADGSEGPDRRGWIEPIDGAGRSQGERVALTPDGEDTPYVRAAVGQTAIGVYYQMPGGGPYFNRLRVVDFDGAELVAPIELEPPGGFGSFGGDILYDGTAFVCTFRSNDGMGGGDVWWIRIAEDGGAVTGPVKVASSGDGDPDGGFDPFSFVSIAASDDTRSVITFVREHHDPQLDLAVPKSQLVVVTADGEVAGPDFIASGTDFQWHWEGRVDGAGDRVMLMWLTDDLNDPSPTIPTALRGALVAPAEAVGHDEGAGTILVQAPETRGEPAFVVTEEAPGILVWTDQRSYVDIQTGRIELMARRVTDDGLATDAGETIGHARFIAGTAHLGGAGAGTNAVITWIDERHGGSIVDPKPEVYLETIWR